MTQKKVKNQGLGNHCIFSPIDLMIKRELLSVVFNLQNQNSEPLNLKVASGGERALKNQ